MKTKKNPLDRPYPTLIDQSMMKSHRLLIINALKSIRISLIIEIEKKIFGIFPMLSNWFHLNPNGNIFKKLFQFRSFSSISIRKDFFQIWSMIIFSLNSFEKIFDNFIKLFFSRRFDIIPIFSYHRFQTDRSDLTMINSLHQQTIVRRTLSIEFNHQSIRLSSQSDFLRTIKSFSRDDHRWDSLWWKSFLLF